MFIVIEGLPRTGKTTVAAEVARRLGIIHCKTRPSPELDMDAYVVGKADAYAHIDWDLNWLIMDRQLPSSYAFACQRGNIMGATQFLEWDKITPCTYIWLKSNDKDIHRIVDRTHEENYHGDPHDVAKAFEFQSYLNLFFGASINRVIEVELWDENEQRRTVNEIAGEIIHNIGRVDWDTYFLNMCDITSHRSTCMSRHVGAVATKNKRVLGIGYNGAPSGMAHCKPDNCGNPNCGSGEGERTVHAEINALLNSTESFRGGTMYCTTEPCLSCTKMLINAGIARVIFRDSYKDELRDKLVKEACLCWTKM